MVLKSVFRRSHRSKTSLSSLPSELILEIVSCSSLTGLDLRNLRLTSRFLANIAASVLFETFYINIDKLQQRGTAFAEDVFPPFIHLVRTLRITVYEPDRPQSTMSPRWRYKNVVMQETDRWLCRLLVFRPYVTTVRLSISPTVLKNIDGLFFESLRSKVGLKLYVNVECDSSDRVDEDYDEGLAVTLPRTITFAGNNLRGFTIARRSAHIRIDAPHAIEEAISCSRSLEEVNVGGLLVNPMKVKVQVKEEEYRPILRALHPSRFSGSLRSLQMRNISVPGSQIKDQDPCSFWSVVIPSLSKTLRELVVLPAGVNGFSYMRSSISSTAVHMCCNLERLGICPVGPGSDDVHLTYLLEWVYEHANLRILELPDHHQHHYPVDSKAPVFYMLVLRRFSKKDQGMMGRGKVFELHVGKEKWKWAEKRITKGWGIGQKVWQFSDPPNSEKNPCDLVYDLSKTWRDANPNWAVRLRTWITFRWVLRRFS